MLEAGLACLKNELPTKHHCLSKISPALSLAFLRCFGHFSSLNPFRALLHVPLCNF
jgi:hypothetical protein